MRLRLDTTVRVFACDIDGCLAAVDHAAYDLPQLQRLVELNRASAHDDSVPALTLLTGRPHGYVDALMQVLDVRLPVVYENGAGLATREPYHAWLLPSAAAGASALAAAREALAARDDVFVQPGKEASLSVFDRGAGRDVAALVRLLADVLPERASTLQIDPSRDCVNLLLPGVDKAAGLRELCRVLGLAESAVAGIGDSEGDAGWLQRCGVSFAPAASAAAVRSAVTHVSRHDDVAAAIEAYEALVAANRALGQTVARTRTNA